MTQQPDHKPGDVVNGHRLGEDLIWHPVEQQTPGQQAPEQQAPEGTTTTTKGGPLSWVGRHKVLAGILAAVLFVGVVGAVSGGSGEGEGDGGSAAAAAGASPSATPTESSEPTPEATAEEASAEDEQPAADDPLDPVLVEKAHGRSGDTYWYVVILENPNKDYIWDSASVDVEAVGKDGTILDSDSNYTVLLSGETALTGMFFDVGNEKIDHLEVRGPTADSATSAPLDETGSFTVSKVKATSDDWSTTVSGTIESGFEEQQDNVEVVVIGRKGGRIKAAEFTYVDRVPSGGRARFEATAFDAPSGLRWTAYANL